jgi:hypothetical protein
MGASCPEEVAPGHCKYKDTLCQYSFHKIRKLFSINSKIILRSAYIRLPNIKYLSASHLCDSL